MKLFDIKNVIPARVRDINPHARLKSKALYFNKAATSIIGIRKGDNVLVADAGLGRLAIVKCDETEICRRKTFAHGKPGNLVAVRLSAFGDLEREYAVSRTNEEYMTQTVWLLEPVKPGADAVGDGDAATRGSKAKGGQHAR